MISAHSYFAFVLASFLLIILPGPSLLVIMSNTLQSGMRGGMSTVFGTALGQVLLLSLLVLGLAPLMTAVAEWFHWLRLLGAAYLIWLGLSKILERATPPEDDNALNDPQNKNKRQKKAFRQGLAVSLSNPKVLLFFAAFLPQFISPHSAAMPQLALLATSFVLIALGVNMCCALLAGTLRPFLSQQRRRIIDKLSGAILVGAGLWLALARR